MKKKKLNHGFLEFKKTLAKIEEEIKNDVSVPVVASFGFIIALIWRDAIRATLDEFLSRAGLLKDAYIYDIVSAIIITVVIMILMVAVTKFSRQKKEERIKERIKSFKTK